MSPDHFKVGDKPLLMNQCPFAALLALLLVLAQTGLLLHKTDLAAHADDSDTCVICLVSHGLDAALTDFGDCPAISMQAALLSYTSPYMIHNAQCRAYSPRAPPTHNGP